VATKEIKMLINDGGIIFMAHIGFMSQSLLAGMIESLKKKETLEGIPSKISHSMFIILIEMTQNIIKYSKIEPVDKNNINSNGLILVGRDKKNNYFVHSQNIVTFKDSIKITKIIDEMNTLTENQIKQKYRELRRSAINAHPRGAGIGFYEIAKRASSIEYDFIEIDSERCNFNLTANIK